MQNIDQHLLESITNSQKNSVFHEGFDSIIRFLNASTFYGLLTPCTNFGVWLYNERRLHFSLDIDNYETPLKAFFTKNSNPRCAHGATGSGGGSGWIVIF